MSRSMLLGDALANAMQGWAEGLGEAKPKLADATPDIRTLAQDAIDRFETICAGNGMTPGQIHEAVNEGIEAINVGLPLTESPIEKAMLPFLVFANYSGFGVFGAPVHDPKTSTVTPRLPVFIVPQFAFVKMRFDFAVCARFKGQTRIIAVECDGRNYHDVLKDRTRDNYLASWNILTVRGHGGEVYTNALGMAQEVAASLESWRLATRGLS